jgi:hypothetical protein
MTGSYWHLLDEEEWAELIRAEHPLSIDRDPTHRGANGSVLSTAGAELDAVACSKVLSIDAELASVISCLGIPLRTVSRLATAEVDESKFDGRAASDIRPLVAGAGRARWALERLQGILRERAARIGGR